MLTFQKICLLRHKRPENLPQTSQAEVPRAAGTTSSSPSCARTPRAGIDAAVRCGRCGGGGGGGVVAQGGLHECWEQVGDDGLVLRNDQRLLLCECLNDEVQHTPEFN